MSYTHTQSTSESKSAYFCHSCMPNATKSGFVKVQHKSLDWKGHVCLLLLFMNDRIQNFCEAIHISRTPY